MFKKVFIIVSAALSLLAIGLAFQNFKSLDAPAEKSSSFSVEKESDSFEAIHQAVIESDISLQQKSKNKKKRYFINESSDRNPSSDD